MRWLTRQTAHLSDHFPYRWLKKLECGQKNFPHSQMTEMSVLYRLHAHCHDTCTLSSVCYVTVDSRYGNIHLCNAAESAFGLLTFRLLPNINPLNPELNTICYLLALLGAHNFLHVSRIRVKSLTFRLLMSYIYIYIYIWSIHS